MRMDVGEDRDPARTKRWRRLLPGQPAAGWVVTGAALVLLAVHLIMRARGRGEGFDAIALVLIGLALSPWFARMVTSLKLGELELSFVEQQLDTQSKQLIEQSKQLAAQRDQLQNILLLSMFTVYEIEHLRQLAADGAITIERSQASEAFLRELRHLRELGAIEMRPGKTLAGLRKDPGQHCDLRDYVEITGKGRAFLAARLALDATFKER